MCDHFVTLSKNRNGLMIILNELKYDKLSADDEKFKFNSV